MPVKGLIDTKFPNIKYKISFVKDVICTLMCICHTESRFPVKMNSAYHRGGSSKEGYFFKACGARL